MLIKNLVYAKKTNSESRNVVVFCAFDLFVVFILRFKNLVKTTFYESKSFIIVTMTFEILMKRNLSYVFPVCHVQHVTGTKPNCTSCGQIQLSFSSCWCPKEKPSELRTQSPKYASLKKRLCIKSWEWTLAAVPSMRCNRRRRHGGQEWDEGAAHNRDKGRRHGGSAHVRNCCTCSIALSHWRVGVRLGCSPVSLELVDEIILYKTKLYYFSWNFCK